MPVGSKKRRCVSLVQYRCPRLKSTKCDQSQPACSRCVRLKIACIGSGERRYKFKQEMIVSITAKVHAAQAFESSFSGLSPTLSNEATRAIGGFISILDVTDPRYDLVCYGGFLKDIPRRLGTNRALDASVDALTSAFSSLYTREHSSAALATYGHAVYVLRICLDDPSMARSVETLCAIYFIMICQVSIAFDQLDCLILTASPGLDGTAWRSFSKPRRGPCEHIE